MVLQASLDESGYGSSIPNDTFVFAGYIGSVSQWTQFTHEWNELSIEHPEILNTRTVKGLMRTPDENVDPLAVQMMQAVCDAGLCSIRWSISYSDFHAVPKAAEDGLYRVAWTATLIRTLAEIRHGNFTLDLFYDQNIGEENKVQKGYREFRDWIDARRPDVVKMLPYRPTPRSDDEFWPLRAADALAWNTHRAILQKSRNQQHSNALWTVLDSGPKCFDVTWTAKDLRDVFE
jgi:hypothetical protein